MAKKIKQKQKSTNSTPKQENSKSGTYEYLRFGESYTSLILGIIVVIIAMIMILGIYKNRHVGQISSISTQNLDDQTQPGFQNTVSQAVTAEPTQIVTPTFTPIPTPTLIPTPISKSNKGKLSVSKKENVYTVVDGDNLWTIAEKKYKSGYNWVDIARANKLSNSDVLNTGDKLIIPNASKKTAESEPDIYGNDFSQQTSSTSTVREEKVTSDKYIVKAGDYLWDIAVRAYGDGYRWVDIAKANNLENPDIINEGTSLNLPRK